MLFNLSAVSGVISLFHLNTIGLCALSHQFVCQKCVCSISLFKAPGSGFTKLFSLTFSILLFSAFIFIIFFFLPFRIYLISLFQCLELNSELIYFLLFFFLLLYHLNIWSYIVLINYHCSCNFWYVIFLLFFKSKFF